MEDRGSATHQTSEVPRRPAFGMSPARLEAFSDGVFAIAVTLLILSVQLPKAAPGQLAGDLLRLWPQYATYAASFLTIGIMWVNHHALVSRVQTVDRPLVLLNLLLLMIVAFLPFPTQVLGSHLGDADAGTAAFFYALASLFIAFGFSGVYVYVARHPHLLHSRFRHSDFRAATPWFMLGMGSYVVGMAASFWSPTLVVALMAATAIYYAYDRLPAPSEPA